VGGEATGAIDPAALRVISWNLNAPKTRKAIDGLLAAFTNSPKGVQEALGRRKPLGDKAVAQLPEVSENDVFLIQEIPLPTAIELADAIGAQVYWVPEFIEVGDNAKGMDPMAGWDFTGNAVMSRLPLSDFRVLRFNNQADWYDGQKADQPLGDKLEKLAAKTLFAVDAGNAHQTRPPLPYGGRVALFARAAAPGRTIWVGDLHLEDLPGKTLDGPQLRCVQMEEALASIKTLDGPVVFGGDLNTMGASVGVGEGEDLATEGPNAMHPAQPPIDRQHGLAAGVGNKFFGVVDAGNLATTLAHDPGSRKMLVLQQSAAIAVDIAPYAPTIHDGINAVRKIRKDPTPGKVVFYSAEVAADFFPYTVVGSNSFKIYRDEKARHDPSSRFNADHTLFRDVRREADAVPLNPRSGFRFGMGGYQSTWASGRPMGLVDTVVDWVFLRDPDHVLQPARGEVLKNVVKGSQTGSRPDDRLSDHYPLRVELAIKDAR
jgi:endonuclease/exonuclease/phosphatase family metal-dependent hydrolase